MHHKFIQVYTPADVTSLILQHGSLEIPKHHAFALQQEVTGATSTITGTMLDPAENVVGVTLNISSEHFEFFPIRLNTITSFSSTTPEGNRDRNSYIIFLR